MLVGLPLQKDDKSVLLRQTSEHFGRLFFCFLFWKISKIPGSRESGILKPACVITRLQQAPGQPWFIFLSIDRCLLLLFFKDFIREKERA